jgi:hypothetical protein
MYSVACVVEVEMYAGFRIPAAVPEFEVENVNVPVARVED